MARDTAVDDTTDDTLMDDQTDDSPVEAFDDEFESALDDELSDETPSDPADDVVEGDLGALDDTDESVAPVEGVDRGDGRDVRGKFATKAEQDAADAKAAAQAPAAGTAPVATEAAPAPVFEPLLVRADKALHPIDEAQITRANGYHVITVKDEDAPRFMQRMSKGIVGERIWRDLQAGVKELEAERAAPQPKSDSQIEAEIIVATLKDRLGELLEPHEIRQLDLEIKLAQRDYKDTYQAERQSYFDAQAEKERAALAPEQEQQTQLRGIAEAMLDLAESRDDLKGMTKKQLEDAYNDLAKISRAVYWKEGDGQWYMDTQLMYDRLQAAKAGTASTTSAPPHGTSATGASTTQTTAADRFNKAGNTAARPGAPGTTSLKANRGKTDPAKRPSRSPDASRNRPAKTAAMIAEDKARQQQRKFMNSASLDFDDDDGDE